MQWTVDSGGRVVPLKTVWTRQRLWWTVNRVHGIQRVSDRIEFMNLCCRSAAQGGSTTKND